LPIVDVAIDNPSHAEQHITGYQGPRKKVLIVDDAVANRMLLVDLLSMLGFEIFQADNGADGLALAQAEVPDLIVMDNIMPVMNGLEATRRLRALPAFSETPIIAASANASDSEKSESLEAGVTTYISKPIDLTRLVQQVGALLQIEWNYDEAAERADSQDENPGSLIFPPREEVEALHQAALRGNMRDIRRRAAHIETLDERYRPLANKLRQLAEGFQTEAIVQLVEQHLGNL
jgi:CheY-like chemotaxis protein